MYTIVGLGNPGDEYRLTRHNIGWHALDTFLSAHMLPGYVQSGTYNALLSEGVVQGVPVSVLLPLAFMNNSGSTVRKYQTAQKRSVHELIVVHDDIALPFGTIRVSVGRGGGGHNGVQSLIDALGSPDFIRVRMGIAPTGFFGRVTRPRGDRLASFVLGTFTKKEQAALPDFCTSAAQAVTSILENGALHTMNQLN